MNTKPKLKISYTKFDWCLQIITILIVCGIWIYIGINYNSLPEQIPVHFDASGNADSFSHKISILIVPIIISSMYVLFLFLQKFPHKFNYPVEITKENAEKQYRLGIRFLRYISLFLTILLTFISVNIIQVALGEKNLLSSWFIIMIILFNFATLILFLFQSYQEK